MTAIRDRRSDPDADGAPVPWDERPVLGARRGLPWWGAVLLAFGLAVVGAVIDLKFFGKTDPGPLFYTLYVLGSVGGVAAVQRRGLFGPMVQPPLVLALSVPGVILLVVGAPNSGQSDGLAKVLQVGQPLINGFPMMAITTVLTLGIGIWRIYRERDPEAVKAKERAMERARERERAEGAKGPRGGAGAPPARGARPADGRTTGPQRRPMPPEGAPPRRRPRPEDADRRRDPDARKTPPPGRGQRPRAPRPEDADRRRNPASGNPRARKPPPPQRGGNPNPDAPRRGPRRPPRANRPWDDEG
ncbi:DUF6542 domain-containing protein [Amycolatopsis sp. CA-230715]|uniref:DUF6542 domain-containing protein n=1 Tax=Amycolatopsis sp. CA-230715 TaxID=2745196 RepID=UPI001C027644|nr:DUF6542 domain-containing protein [Amycolatopsis sp. CA-230715]QWF82169.1 hypothetical protein HUW46_05606 [Amycolatopsis sp. CA-230715]